MKKGKLTVNLTDLEVNRFGTWEARNEVYLLTIGADLSGLGQHRIDVPDLIMPEGFANAHDYLVLGVSPLFTGIKRGDHLALLGDGLNLYGPKDPRGKVSLHCAVMESDSDHRKLAEKITQGLSGQGLPQMLEMATQGNQWARAATVILRYVFERVLYFLKIDDDDVITTFHYSSTLRNNRELPDGVIVRTPSYRTGAFNFKNRYVEATIDATWTDAPLNARKVDEVPYA